MDRFGNWTSKSDSVRGEHWNQCVPCCATGRSSSTTHDIPPFLVGRGSRVRAAAAGRMDRFGNRMRESDAGIGSGPRAPDVAAGMPFAWIVGFGACRCRYDGVPGVDWDQPCGIPGTPCAPRARSRWSVCRRRREKVAWERPARHGPGSGPGSGSGVFGVATRGCGSEAMMRHKGSSRTLGAWTRFKHVMAVSAPGARGGVCDVDE